MATALRPVQYRAINRAVGPGFDRWSKRKYGISGKRLLAKLALGEGTGVSSAGARHSFQFIASTRNDFRRRFGIDPWKSPYEGARAAIIHLMGKGGAYGGGLRGYSPGGGQGYVDYILGQNVDTRPLRTGGYGGGARAPRGGRSGGVAVTQPSISRETVGPGGEGIVPLLRQIREQQAPPLPQAAPLQAPQFSAQATLPKGYQPLDSGPPPQQPQSMDELLGAVKGLSGGSIPKSTVTPGSVSPNGAGGGSRSLARSPDAGNSLGRMLRIANAWDKAGVRYQWGGGHGSKPAKAGTPVDCSGYVSAILGVTPRVSGDFTKWGQAGRGRHVSVYANSGHVLVAIRTGGHTRWYATSHENPGGGAGRRSTPSKQYLRGFAVRHPRGL